MSTRNVANMPSCHLIKGRRCRKKCRRSGNERIVGKSWRVRQSREATQTGELEEENGKVESHDVNQEWKHRDRQNCDDDLVEES